MSQNGLILDLGGVSLLKANEILAECEHQLREIAHRWNQPMLMVRNGDKEWEIKAGQNQPRQELQTPQPDWNLLGADFRRMHEFLIEAREQGLIVAITSQDTDICRFTNDLLTPARAKLHGRDMAGYNYREAWRRDRNSGIDQLNPQLEHLKQALERDGYVPDYEYTLFRRVDNAQCEYSTDYYLCRDYCGETVRIGVSRPEAYRVLSVA